jgi:DNA polymerase
MSNNAYLKAMGIDVWVERNPSVPDTINFPEDSSFEKDKNIESLVEVTPEVAIKESTAEPIVEIKIEELDWQSLRSLVSKCQNCDLAKNRTQTVFGSGKQTASLMIIGDAPNEEDDKQGNVFSGQSGKLLTAMLKAMGYQRNDVYVSNIVKCHTSENKEPEEDEAASCEPYLIRQINLVQPKLILALGSAAAQWLLKSKSTIGRLRGQLHFVDNVNAPILVSYHPAYLLRAPNEKRKAWEDLQIAMKELAIKEPAE